MDIARTPDTSLLKRFWPVLAALGAGLGVYLFVISTGSADFRVDRDTLLFATVERGDLLVKVRGAGFLVPQEIRWVASSVAGRVERVLVKPGAEVAAGQLLVELSNPELHQALEEARWELEALEAESEAARVALETAALDQRAAMLQAGFEFKSARIDAESDAALFQKGIISKLESERSEMKSLQLKELWDIEKKRLEKSHENLAEQKNALAARQMKMQRTLQQAEDRVSNLAVRATMDSVVQDVAVQTGQRMTIGSNIAKLAVQGQLIAELQIPEAQVRDVSLDQPAVVETRNSSINGVVHRIAPSVTNGSVQVDVKLIGEMPRDARLDSSITGEIRVGDFKDTLFVRRPAFAQSNAVVVVFKETADHEFIEKISVRFGRGSLDQIQVLEGLEVGDRVVVSDYANLESYSRVRLH
jgi:multidrug resistance efflux pump